MSGQPSGGPETVDDDLANQAAELIQEADQQLQQNREEQQEFLNTVSEEEGAEVLETQCNLIGDYTVPNRVSVSRTTRARKATKSRRSRTRCARFSRT